MIFISKAINFEISDFEFCKFLDEDTALTKVKVCSSGDNAHGFPFTAETLKEAAEASLKGKPIVAKFNERRQDFEGHSKLEVPIGYFVEHQDFVFEEEDGKVSLFAYAILWKTYAPREYALFVRKKEIGADPIKGVSMEIKPLEWGEEGSWEGNFNKKEIKKFRFKGVTLLGDSYTPASPGANAQMISFTKLKNRTEKYFTDTMVKIDKKTDNHSYIEKNMLDLGLSKTNFAKKEEEEMALNEENIIEAKEEATFAETEVETVFETKEEEIVKEEEAEVETNETENKEEENYEVKCQAMEKELADVKACNEVYMSKIKELEAYKFSREDADKNFTIEETIIKVSKLLPKNIIDEYREKAKEIDFSSVTGFCNEIKARVVDFADFAKEETPNKMAVLTNENNQVGNKNKWKF